MNPINITGIGNVKIAQNNIIQIYVPWKENDIFTPIRFTVRVQMKLSVL